MQKSHDAQVQSLMEKLKDFEFERENAMQQEGGEVDRLKVPTSRFGLGSTLFCWGALPNGSYLSTCLQWYRGSLRKWKGSWLRRKRCFPFLAHSCAMGGVRVAAAKCGNLKPSSSGERSGQGEGGCGAGDDGDVAQRSHIQVEGQGRRAFDAIL